MTKRTQDFENFMSSRVNLSKQRHERLQTGARDVSEHLSRTLPGFIKTERQGSLALGTVIRPVNNREFDVDMLAFMRASRLKAPKDYIEEVYRAMKANGNYADKVHRKARCVTVDYAGDFHMDIVPCVEMRGGLFICNGRTDEFEPTDGTGFRDWFNGKNAVTYGNLKRVVRLLKYLRDRKRTFTAPSILLTALVGNAVRNADDGADFKTLPDALKTVANRVNDFLQANPFKPRIANPVLPEEDFSRDWDPVKYRNFRDMFGSCATRINNAFSESDHARSATAWRDLFGDGFGDCSNCGLEEETRVWGNPRASASSPSSYPDIGLSASSTVFISYSWDDATHKRWVQNLAARLESDGVDVRLDETGLKPGDSIAKFIEDSLAASDFVLVICTPEYKKRYGDDKGGVAYEGSIIAGAILSGDIKRDHVIPVLRNAGPDSIPASIAVNLGVDLSDSNPDSERQYTKLLQRLISHR